MENSVESGKKIILFISGSLRKGSYNLQLSRKASSILEEHFECRFLSYDEIPYLDQDVEFPPPSSVERVRTEVESASVVLISTPEYNHSYSGVLKNLLDWLSRPREAGNYDSAVIRGKLIALSAVAGSSGGSFALGKLEELMEMFSCSVIKSVVKVALGSRFGEEVLTLDGKEEEVLEKECSEILSLFQSEERSVFP